MGMQFMGALAIMQPLAAVGNNGKPYQGNTK
jgi:hypothetical protein